MRPAVRRGRGDRKRRGGAAAHRPSPPGRWAEGGTGDGRGFFSPPSPPPAALGQGLSGAGSLRARLFIVDFTFFSFSFVGFIVGGWTPPATAGAAFQTVRTARVPSVLSRGGSGCLCPRSPFPSLPASRRPGKPQRARGEPRTNQPLPGAPCPWGGGDVRGMR